MNISSTHHWFLIVEPAPLPAARNMAVDEYLFNLCHYEKLGFLRLYAWEKPTFSLGVSQKTQKAVDLDFISSHDCSLVRRITGGKTVLHDDEITYSVISSEDIFYQDNDLYRSYLLISRVLAEAFKNIGLDAYLSQGSSSHLSKTHNPCFSFPTPNELEINGKKIAGSAQKRDNLALLQHGSIPVSMNYELYSGGTYTQIDALKRSMTTLNEVTSNPNAREQLCKALISCFEDFLRTRVEKFEFDRNDNDAIAEIEKKYLSKDWNFRF